ncbi:MAG: hypothetical protein ACE5EX_09425, partial [Phycisphaerae bacterium]
SEGRRTEGGIFPRRRVATNEPPAPAKPPPGLPEPDVARLDPARIFDAIVKEFIREYGLEKGQITSAYSILSEFKAKADDFSAGKKEEFSAIIAALKEAHERRDVAAVRRATAEHKKLLEPVYQLTSLMEERLKGLLTSAQVQRHDAKIAAAGKQARPGARTAKPPTKSSAVLADDRTPTPRSKVKNNNE